MTFTPRAPACIVVCTAFFTARRKAIRRFSCSAMTSATRPADSSGRLISWIVRWTVVSAIF